MLQFTLKVVDIKQETGDTVTICFKQPGLKKVKYLAGQYLTLVFNIDGRRYFRPYSFSSAPNIDSTLNITIKRVPHGVVSNYIVNHINIGDTVETKEPLGDFTLENNNVPDDSNLFFWGAGSGITPLFSLIKYALHNKLTKHITLVYGNRNQESTIFYQQIDELQKEYPAIFTVKYFNTKAVAVDLNITQGRIDVQTATAILTESNDLTKTYHFICGPQGLKQSVEEVLQNRNISRDRIIYESFELNLNPEDFEGIITQNVILQKSNEIYTIEVLKGKTILEAGLDAMIDLSYSCQIGTCLLCKAKLLSGAVKMIGPAKNIEKLNQGEYLLCCSLPLTADAKLSVF